MHDFFVALDAPDSRYRWCDRAARRQWFLRFERRSPNKKRPFGGPSRSIGFGKECIGTIGAINHHPNSKPESIRSVDQPITTVTIQQEGKTLIFAPKIEIEGTECW